MMRVISLLLLLSLANCTYRPVVDSAGRSGTFPESKASEISNDIQHCEYQAKKNTNTLVEVSKKSYNYLIRPKLLWLSPKARDDYKMMMVNCLNNRGHSVLNR